jgi:F-type H+-transporting ATPase subunit delta
MEAAGRLAKLSLDANTDLVEQVFTILKLAQDAPLAQTLATYRDLKANWLTLAEITTARQLSAAQKTKVQRYLSNTMGPNLCFLYTVDPHILGGIKVQVGDNMFDKSILTKIYDL